MGHMTSTSSLLGWFVIRWQTLNIVYLHIKSDNSRDMIVAPNFKMSYVTLMTPVCHLVCHP